MHPLKDYEIEEVDLQGDTSVYSPSNERIVHKEHRNTRESENAAKLFYSDELDYHVADIDHKYEQKLERAVDQLPDGFKEFLIADIQRNTEIDSKQKALDHVDRKGIPDLIMCAEKDFKEYQFVEVKMESERLLASQERWFQQFSFFPIKVTRIHRNFQPVNISETITEEPDTHDAELLEEFELWKLHYRKRPATGTRAENDGVASIVTLLHYGLLDATGHDTGVIHSLSKDVLAASLAAIRDEDETTVKRYLRTKDTTQLKDELSREMSTRFGSTNNSDLIQFEGVIGGTAASICAMLRSLDRADPLTSTKKHLDGPTI